MHSSRIHTVRTLLYEGVSLTEIPPFTETPPGQRPPPWTETPPPVDGQIPVKTLPSQTSFTGNKNQEVKVSNVYFMTLGENTLKTSAIKCLHEINKS